MTNPVPPTAPRAGHERPSLALRVFPVVAAIFVGAALALFAVVNPMDLALLRPFHSLLGGPAPEAAGPHAEGTLWTCGMHPQVLQDEAGRCPICQMVLVPLHPEGVDQPAPSDPLREETFIASLNDAYRVTPSVHPAAS